MCAIWAMVLPDGNLLQNAHVMVVNMVTKLCILCSVQSRNLHNLEIVLRILRIQKLRANLENAQPILRLGNTFAQSWNCAIRLRSLEIVRAQFANIMG